MRGEAPAAVRIIIRTRVKPTVVVAVVPKAREIDATLDQAPRGSPMAVFPEP